MRRFASGESIVWRSIDRDARHVQTVWPWTVVRDEPDLIVLYLPVGTIGKQRTGDRGGPRDRMMVRWDGGYRDRPWHSVNVIRLYREEDDFSLWLARDGATGDVAWRYINLEDPWRRTSIGFDSCDRWLDLGAWPGEDWQWKDEDEIEWLVANGRLGQDVAAAIRASGERALALVRGGERGIARKWSTWRAEPSWQVPTIPANWADLEPR